MTAGGGGLLERLDEADDRDAALLELLLQRTREREPEFADLMLAAAVPRSIDEKIAHVLAAATGYSRDGAWKRIGRVNFAVARDDGSLVYHDSMRSAILAVLREDDALAPLFRRASEALLIHYQRAHHDARERYQDAQRVARALRTANPARLSQVLDAAERAMIPSALEMIYHATLVDADLGCAAFEQLFEEHASAGRTVACQALLVGVEAALREAAPSALDERRMWLTCWHGRLAAAVGDDEAAERAFRTALGAPLPVELELMVLKGLADVLTAQERLGEALELQQRQLRLATASPAHHEWARGAYFALGSLEIGLGRFDAALHAYEQALATAVERDDHLMEPLARTAVGQTLVVLGERERGRREILHGFDLARRLGDAQISSAAAGGVLALLRARDARLCETLEHERRAVDASKVGPRRALATEIQRLVKFGQLERARDVLARATAEPPGEIAADEGELLLAAAALHAALGENERAADALDAALELAERAKLGHSLRARALEARAEARLTLGRPYDAGADARRALAAWEHIGDVPSRGRMRLYLAVAAIAGGRLDEADAELDAAHDDVAAAPPYLVSFNYVHGRLLTARGRHADALAAFDRGRRIGDRLGEPSLSMAVEASRSAATLSDLPRLVEYSTAITKLAAEAAVWRNYRPDPDADALDRRHAEGVASLQRITDEGGAALARARDRLVGCVEREPDHPIYRLDLGYACTALGDFDEAARQLDAAVALAPDLLGDSAIGRRAAECLYRAGRRLLNTRDASGAVTTLDRAAARFAVGDPLLPNVLLARADALARAGRREDAEAAYSLADRLADTPRKAALAARRAVLRAADGDDPAPLLAEALALHAATTSPFWATVRDCSPLVWDSGPPPALSQAIRALLADPDTGATMSSFTPHLTADLPSDWFAKESITLLAPDGRANVIASSEPVPSDVDTVRYAATQGNLLEKDFRGFEQHRFEALELLGRRAVYLREFSWTPPDGEPVTQVQLYHVDGGRGYTATATTTSDRYPDLALELRLILEGLAIRDEEGPAA